MLVYAAFLDAQMFYLVEDKFDFKVVYLIEYNCFTYFAIQSELQMVWNKFYSLQD